MKYLWLLLLLPSCSAPQPAHERYNLDLISREWFRSPMSPVKEVWRWSFEKVHDPFDLNKDWKVDMRDVAMLQNYFGESDE